MFRFVLHTFLFSLFAFTAFSQSQPLLGPKKNLFRVEQVKVEGARKVEPEAILDKMNARVGVVVDNYLIRNDLARIYDMKHFENVEIHREKVNGKNTLIVKIVEKPIISKIIIDGNAEIDDDEIKEQIKTR